MLSILRLLTKEVLNNFGFFKVIRVSSLTGQNRDKSSSLGRNSATTALLNSCLNSILSILTHSCSYSPRIIITCLPFLSLLIYMFGCFLDDFLAPDLFATLTHPVTMSGTVEVIFKFVADFLKLFLFHIFFSL